MKSAVRIVSSPQTCYIMLLMSVTSLAYIVKINIDSLF
jgi:hypothetical protein